MKDLGGSVLDALQLIANDFPGQEECVGFARFDPRASVGIVLVRPSIEPQSQVVLVSILQALSGSPIIERKKWCVDVDK